MEHRGLVLRRTSPHPIDAMHATRAAVEEGIVPGGGGALLRASEHLKGIRTKNDDQKTGVEIVRKALSYPARQIAINAGEDGSVIVGKMLEEDQYSYGFDSQTGEYFNLISKGIIDPTKVVRVAIQNAALVAALLISTEAMVAEVPKKNAGGGMPAGWRRHGPVWVVWTSKSNRSALKRKRKARAAMPGLSALAAHGRISQIFPMRNPTKADAMEPSSDSRNNRIWLSSREPDIHEVVNPSDLLKRVNWRPKKNRPLLIGLEKLVAGRIAICKIRN
jgi:hypothetical protein